MAFDIAAIQDLYGANTNYRTGDDTYVLGHANGQLDEFLAIWDAGGTDEIVYAGHFNAIIDLREATPENGPGGGGFLTPRAAKAMTRSLATTRTTGWLAAPVATS
jgi:serralysin